MNGHLLSAFNRGFVFIKGQDALQLLQNLLTCDVYKASYGFLLTPNGRFLFDVFIIPHDDGYLLDVYNKVDFIKKLRLYKLGLNVVIEDFEGYVGWTFDKPTSGLYYPESRFYGYRLKLERPFENIEEYHMHRIKNGISDSPWDLIPEKSIILEHNIPSDAISYDKGCYMGQELIARTYHTGVIRKKITFFEIVSGDVQYGDELEHEGGKIYSVIQNMCLVMLRQDNPLQAVLQESVQLTTTKQALLKRIF